MFNQLEWQHLNSPAPSALENGEWTTQEKKLSIGVTDGAMQPGLYSSLPVGGARPPDNAPCGAEAGAAAGAVALLQL